MKKIGILGGTFDPPHIGHFIIAQEVKNSLQLDEIWFIPTNIPPHKEEAQSSPADRLQMLLEETEDKAEYFVHPIELERTGKSYTIDTITALKAEWPDYQFYFIIGADMVEYLPQWHQIDTLIAEVTFVGVNRTGYSLDSSYPVEIIDVPLIDISSTEIKKRIKKGWDVEYFLPSKVDRLVKEKKLYGYRRG